MANTEPSPLSFKELKDCELEAIRASRGKRQIAIDGPLVGLALSGGGIRSATFNLGLLQALANGNAILSIDYISAVSGGAYIAASGLYQTGTNARFFRRYRCPLSEARDT